MAAAQPRNSGVAQIIWPESASLDTSFRDGEALNLMRRHPACQHVKRVISIIGPQGTGKSSLLNSLFGTNFSTLPPNKNHGQTTNGIWMAKYSINASVIIMDTEGSDAAKRAEDPMAFESRAALLALSISDFLLLNIEARALGQNYGSCSALLQRMFQGITAFPKHKTTLVVILRDCQSLEQSTDRDVAHQNIEKIWDRAHGRNDSCRFEDYIQVHVEQFPDKRNRDFSREYERKCRELRVVLLTRPAQNKPLTADGFLTDVRGKWQAIMANKKFDMPSFHASMSEQRCRTMFNTLSNSLDSDKDFSALRKMSADPDHQSFKRKLERLLRSLDQRFNTETDGCAKETKVKYRQQLRNNIAQILRDNMVRISEKAIYDELLNAKKGVFKNIFELSFNIEAFDSFNEEQFIRPQVETFRSIFKADQCKIPEDIVHTLQQELQYYTEKEGKKLTKWHKIWVGIGKGLCVTFIITASAGVAAGAFFVFYLLPHAAIEPAIKIAEALLALIIPAAKEAAKHMWAQAQAHKDVKENIAEIIVKLKKTGMLEMDLTVLMMYLILNSGLSKQNLQDLFATDMPNQKTRQTFLANLARQGLSLPKYY